MLNVAVEDQNGLVGSEFKLLERDEQGNLFPQTDL